MLISITNKCRMNCPHCLDDALPDNEDFMSFETFLHAIDFNNKYEVLNHIMITGGEPTEHPDFWKFLGYLVETARPSTIITVTSNGMNFDKDDGTILKGILSLSKTAAERMCHLMFQITSVPDLYPYQIDLDNDIFSLDNFVICREIEAMYPQGRALQGDFEFKTNGPKCFNIRSYVNSERNIGLKDVLLFLRKSLKFCNPHINFDGSIGLGEGRLCPSVGTIFDSEQTIIDNIRNCKCQQCKISFEKLTPLHLKAIGL